ncbi:MAG: RluA family pseudouridine synthase [Dehalococcoidia bacterium]|nr:RluA family pseudouridine synthase [Dehalococcoidia bacterium]
MSGDTHRFAAGAPDRLDRAIAAAVPALSRAQAQRLIAAGHVRVADTAVAHAAYAVDAGTLIEVSVPPAPPADAPPAFDVLYEDEHTLVLDKPPGLIVHSVPGRSGPTLVDAVRAHAPEIGDIDGSDRPGVVHRLDRDTSGVLAYAKTEAAWSYLKQQWRDRETLKQYLALVAGRVDPSAGIIDAELGPDPNDPRRRAVVERGESALSEYHVREQYGDEAALLEVRIFTGRTHQIRVHLEATGHPVLGDVHYGRASALIPRQALHAWRLGFRLPATDEWREFEAPVPADIAAAVALLRLRHRGVTPWLVLP